VTTAADDLLPVMPGVLRRDPDAWEALYRSMYTRLYAYARRRLSDDHAANDAVSETMARALDRIDGFQPYGAGLPGWLYGILRNVLRESYRAGARTTVPGLDDDDPAYDDDWVGHELDPLSYVLADERAKDVRAAFRRLSSADRELLELRVVGGLNADDVALALGKRAGAVRMAQSRALARLRDELEEVSGVD
jgi:RNA polymerase sigma-70 factor, ECF subfamily